MENAINSLVEDILAKKELSNLDDELVLEKAKEFLKKRKKISEKLSHNKYSEFKRSKEYKEVIKNIRAELREVYGVFIMKDYQKRHNLLEKLKKNPSIEQHDKILALHKSSKERLPYYPIIYKRIFEITGHPKRIIDFACGLNPLSYPYLGCKPEYLACDLAQKDLDFIEEYFEIMKINGKTKKIDLIKDNLKGLVKKEDLVFLFKTLDSLESVKRDVSEQILRNLAAKHIIVSFSNKSLGGKKIIRKERRKWFERLISQLSYSSNSFEIPGELFYIITK